MRRGPTTLFDSLLHTVPLPLGERLAGSAGCSTPAHSARETLSGHLPAARSGRARHTPFRDETGDVPDDLVAHRLVASRYPLVTTAAAAPDAPRVPYQARVTDHDATAREHRGAGPSRRRTGPDRRRSPPCRSTAVRAEPPLLPRRP